MKTFRLTALFFLLLAGVAGAEPATAPSSGSSERALSLFKAGRYADGIKSLTEISIRPQYPAEERARAQITLADFYWQYADSSSDAIQYYTEISRFDLPLNHPLVQEADKKIAQLKEKENRFQKENELLAGASSITRPDDEVLLRTQVENLTRLIHDYPDYPHLALACFYLGKAHFYLGHYRTAREYINRALQIRPALDFSVPVSSLRADAQKRWVRQVLTQSSWVVLGVFWVVVAALFFFSRPWTWLGFRQALSLIILQILWGVCFLGMVWLTQQGRPLPVPDGICDHPAYVVRGFIVPLTDVLGLFFWYGVIGVFGSWLLAVSTARFRLRWTWAFINASAALLLFAALLTVFSLRYCSTPFFPDLQSRWSYLNGVVAYPLTRSQYTIFLTDPKAYPKFQVNLALLSEPDIREWFTHYIGPPTNPAPGPVTAPSSTVP